MSPFRCLGGRKGGGAEKWSALQSVKQPKSITQLVLPPMLSTIFGDTGLTAVAVKIA